METIKAILLIILLCLLFFIVWQIISFYLAGEVLKAIFWLLILILFTETKKTYK